MPHHRDFFGGASCLPYPTPAPDRATVWSTGPAATAASTAVCRSAWHRAWAEMVRQRQTHSHRSFAAWVIPGCSFIHLFVPLSCEVWSDVQTSAGLFDCWSGETPTAAAATAAASGRRPARLVLLHQGPSGPLPAAPSAHGLSLHRGGRVAVLLRWCSPVPHVLPSWVAGVKYDLPRIGNLYCVKIPRKGGHQRTPWPKRLGAYYKTGIAVCCSRHPALLTLYFSRQLRIWAQTASSRSRGLQPSGGSLQPLSSLSEKHGWANSTAG